MPPHGGPGAAPQLRRAAPDPARVTVTSATAVPRVARKTPLPAKAHPAAQSAPEAPDPDPDTPPDMQAVRFVGGKGRLFWLAFRTGLLTILTLGIYRFWAKTRLRRWYWSSTRPGGYPLEYVGDPWEKLLGFLIAVVILAFYIGVVNLILMFASFAIFHGNVAAYVLSFLGVIPLWFFAQYRARRYVLARTRWRGIRFGLEPGAWGYAWRALVHWSLTLVSLGLLWPRMTFWLEKYKTDRTWYGTQRLTQGGQWTMLYQAAWPMIVLFVIAGGLGGAAFAETLGSPDVANAALVDRVAQLIPLAVLWGFAFLVALAFYRVRTLKLLTNAKSGGEIGLDASPRTGRIFVIYFFGLIATYLILAILVAPLSIVLVTMQIGNAMPGADGALFDLIADLPDWAALAVSIMLYFAVFLIWSTLQHVFVTMPVWRHYANTLLVTGTGHLDLVQQRARDDAEQAEGFAEALDVGAAI